MKKKMLMIFGLVLVSIFIVSCGTGQAVKAGDRTSAGKSAKLCLKDYEIGAFVTKDLPHSGEYVVNQVASGNLKPGESKVLAGVKLIHNNSLFQDYAGGVKTTQFKLEKACSKDYWVTASVTAPVILGNELLADAKGTFVMNGETFDLSVGGTKVLADGTKVILTNVLIQDYAGGMQGLFFELICS